MWAASVAPHKDVGLSEATAAKRLCEHLLLLSRRQRAALGAAADAHAALATLLAWLHPPAADAAGAGPAAAVPPQACSLQWLGRQKAALDRLEVLASDTGELLAACMEASPNASPGMGAAQLRQARAACAAWGARLGEAKRELGACAQVRRARSRCSRVVTRTQACR